MRGESREDLYQLFIKAIELCGGWNYILCYCIVAVPVVKDNGVFAGCLV